MDKRGWACVETCIEQGIPITASYMNEIVKATKRFAFSVERVVGSASKRQ